MAGVCEFLSQRGFVEQTTDDAILSSKLRTEQLTLYAGFDPTGASLHIGHLIPLYAMAHCARAGHKIIAVIGSGTARIGDPSGKDKMRRILDVSVIEKNSASIQEQISAFFRAAGVSVIIEDNIHWLQDLNYISFLRDYGHRFSVNRMLSFETYKRRLEQGLSFLEFNYQLLQAYDFLELYRRHNCVLQVGGADQWANIIAGADLIRRVERAEAYGLTCKLIERSDGKKMGKTEEGAVFLDASLTPVFEFYQYWRNMQDSDVLRFLRLYTFLGDEKIAEYQDLQGASLNEVKEVLAYEVTKHIHGELQAKEVQNATRAVFGNMKNAHEGNITNAHEIDVPHFVITERALNEGLLFTQVYVDSGLCTSKSEVRRLIAQGGARIGEVLISDIDMKLGLEHFTENKVLLRAGKKKIIQLEIRKEK